LARAEGIAPRSSRREPNLEWLAEAIGLPAVNPHHALGDATTTAQVFLALSSRLGRLGYRTALDFVDLTAGDQALKRR
jgi:DNA polymerase-3 subunit epsilon